MTVSTAEACEFSVANLANAGFPVPVRAHFPNPESTEGGRRVSDAKRQELHQPPGLHVRALQLASQLKQNAAYDAHYLALAERFGCELWTADERFYRAANPSVDNVRWLGEFVAPE